jgi:hypothetical protein
MASDADVRTERIFAFWHAPPLSTGDERPVRMVRAVERILPWVQLRYRNPGGADFGVSADDYRRLLLDAFSRGELPFEGADVPVPLADRDRWLLDAAARDELLLIHNNTEERMVTLSQQEVWIGPQLAPELCICGRFPPEPEVWRHAADLVAAVGVALGASYGWGSPGRTGAALRNQFVSGLPDPDRPPPGLPALLAREALDSPDVPFLLGWVNYWSKEAAARIGFPDPGRHAELLERARQVEGGGWVVQLTDEPLDICFREHTWCAGEYKAPEEPRDLSNPAHLRALQRAYELLPAIGGRDKPARSDERAWTP